MLIVALVFLVTFVYTLVAVWDNGKFGRIGWAFFAATIAGGLTLIFVALFSMRFVHNSYYDPVEVKLVAMRSLDSVHGDFVFATGQIDGELDYLYYEVTPDGGYQANRVKATRSNVVIYEDMSQGGRLVIRQCHGTPPDTFWGRNFLVGNNVCLTRYEFHIPKGSLVQQFKLGN
jgi:hypothetical protein